MSQWIPLCKRKPQKDQKCLIACTWTSKINGYQQHGVFDDVWLGKGWKNDSEGGFEVVTHWMPYPKHPLEKP